MRRNSPTGPETTTAGVEQKTSEGGVPMELVKRLKFGVVAAAANDAHIIEAFVRHHLSAVADVVIVGHRASSDRTRMILIELEREGLPVVLFDRPDVAGGTWSDLGVLSDNAARFFQLDFVFLLSVNEFVICPSVADLSDQLQQLRVSPSLARHSYVPTSADEPLQSNPVARLRHRLPEAEWVTGRLVASSRFVYENPEMKTLGQPAERTSDNTARFTAARLARFQLETLGRVPDRIPVAGNKGGTPHVAPTSLVLDPIPAPYSLAYSDRPSIVSRQTPGARLADVEPQRHSGHITESDKGRPWNSYSVGNAGIFDVSFHLDNLYLDLPPFRYIWERYQPRSVLDLGCGLGGYIQAFREWGVDTVQGVDGFDYDERILCGRSYMQKDLREPLDLGKKFDLVICSEVIEHLPEDYEEVLIHTVERHAEKWILFSAARPRQPGLGHVNCKPFDYWIDVWRRLGWKPLTFDTQAIRALSSFFWLRRNAVLLCPPPHGEAYHTLQHHDLDSFEAGSVKWIGQPAGIYRFPVTEPLPTTDEQPPSLSASEPHAQKR